MYTSDTERNAMPARLGIPEDKPESSEDREKRKTALRIARNYAIVALICLAVGLIYEFFSHGVYSPYMVFGFVVPLLFGVLPNLVIGLGGLKTPGFAAENIYAGGVITWTLGIMLKGVLQIFGTTNGLVKYYFWVGTFLLLLGAIVYLAQRKKKAEVEVVEAPVQPVAAMPYFISGPVAGDPDSVIELSGPTPEPEALEPEVPEVSEPKPEATETPEPESTETPEPEEPETITE